MTETREVDGVLYRIEMVDADELEPGDIVIHDHDGTVEMVKSSEVSIQDNGECSDPECCWQGYYLDIYFVGDGYYWCGQNYPQERILEVLDF